MILPTRLTPKLTVLFVLFALAVTAGLGSFVYVIGRSALLEATISGLNSAALEKEAALDQWFDEGRRDVIRIARTEHIGRQVRELTLEAPGSAVGRKLARTMRDELGQWAGKDGTYESMFVIEADRGEVIISTDPRDEGMFKENRPYFVNGRLAPYLQNPYYSITRQAPGAVASAPIRTTEGKVIGVLAARLKLSEMNAIVGRRTGLHETDDSYLVDASHLLVTQPRLVGDPSVLQRGIYTPAVDRCLAGEHVTEIGTDFRGVPVIGVYRWLAERRLCLVTKISAAEALEDVRRLGKAILMSALLVLISAALIATVLACIVTRPVLALQAGAAAIGRGDRTKRLPET